MSWFDSQFTHSIQSDPATWFLESVEPFVSYSRVNSCYSYKAEKLIPPSSSSSTRQARQARLNFTIKHYNGQITPENRTCIRGPPSMGYGVVDILIF